MNLLIDSSFQPTYQSLQKNLPHATLLHGPNGVGLYTIATSLVKRASETITIRPTQKTKSALASIGVERIRELYEQVASNATQVIIIDDADKMTETAQNALLKLLEEPNRTTRFILTSHHPEQLLPTVRSRTQSHFVPKLSGSEISTFIENTTSLSEAKKRQISFLATGLPAEVIRLIRSDEYFLQRSLQIQLVKKLIGVNSYDVLAILLKEKLDRTQALQLIQDAFLLLRITPTETGVRKIKALLTAYEAITNGGNARLHLVRAMV